MIEPIIQMQAQLKERVLERHGPMDQIRAAFQRKDQPMIQALISSINHEWSRMPSLHSALSTSGYFADRMRQLALEDLQSERSCPPIIPIPNGQQHLFLSLLPSAPIWFAIMFDQFPHIGNEVFPLMIDALVAKQAIIIAAHADWIADGFRVNRALLYDPSNDALLECPFMEPFQPAAVFHLAMNRSAHQSLSQKAAQAGIIEINPFDAAAIADSKWACFKTWKEHGINTPDTAFVAQEEDSRSIQTNLLSLIERCPQGCVVQPDHGTEGKGVSVFQWNKNALESQITQAMSTVAEIQRYDDVVIRQFIPFPSGSTFPYDLRVNAAYDGSAYHCESGCLMDCPLGGHITSPERGGTIHKFHEIQNAHLSGRDSPPILAALHQAQQAAQTLRPLGLIGVDIRFEEKSDGAFAAWALDANPRPAGLAHSEYFHTGEPGVSQRLWQAASIL